MKKLGAIRLKNKGILAPMLGYTNSSFRELCLNNQCALACSEMVHLSYILNSKIDFSSSFPFCLQLVGDFTKTKETISSFLKIQDYKNVLAIDFNLGCPSLKIAAGNSGVVLLDKIEKVSQTLKEIKEISSKPVTAKIRLGYKQNNINFILKTLDKINLDAITIHSRLGVDDYSVPADYRLIQQLSKTVSTPIIYNGDISFNNLEKIDCDSFLGLMVGRTALKDPTIFSVIANKNQTPLFENISNFIKISKKNNNSLQNQKLVLLMMVSGFLGARKLREKITIIKSQEQIDDLVSEIKILEQQTNLRK